MIYGLCISNYHKIATSEQRSNTRKLSWCKWGWKSSAVKHRKKNINLLQFTPSRNTPHHLPDIFLFSKRACGNALSTNTSWQDCNIGRENKTKTAMESVRQNQHLMPPAAQRNAQARPPSPSTSSPTAGMAPTLIAFSFITHQDAKQTYDKARTPVNPNKSHGP